MTKNIGVALSRVLAVAPTPHTASEYGDRTVIVGSNGRVLGWVATTSGDHKAVAELWSKAPEMIEILTRRITELEYDRERYRDTLVLIRAHCRYEKWEHGLDSDESGTWVTCEQRGVIEAITEEALGSDVSLLHPEVQHFARLMESRLRANDHKPGWKQDEVRALLDRLREEVAELDVATIPEQGRSPKEIAREAADVANFAMMIADVCGGLG